MRVDGRVAVVDVVADDAVARVVEADTFFWCCVDLPGPPGCNPMAVQADMSGGASHMSVHACLGGVVSVLSDVVCGLENMLPLVRFPQSIDFLKES